MTRRLLPPFLLAFAVTLVVLAPAHAWTHCDDPKLREPDCPTTTTKPAVTTTKPAVTTTTTKPPTIIPPLVPVAVIAQPKLTG